MPAAHFSFQPAKESGSKFRNRLMSWDGSFVTRNKIELDLPAWNGIWNHTVIWNGKLELWDGKLKSGTVNWNSEMVNWNSATVNWNFATVNWNFATVNWNFETVNWNFETVNWNSATVKIQRLSALATILSWKFSAASRPELLKPLYFSSRYTQNPYIFFKCPDFAFSDPRFFLHIVFFCSFFKNKKN